MDNNTRAIVASNLTIAVYAGHKVESAQAVLMTYREMFARLGDDSRVSDEDDQPARNRGKGE